MKSHARTRIRPVSSGCALILVLVHLAAAEDVTFRKSVLAIPGSGKPTHVELLVSDSSLRIRSKTGTSVSLETPYSSMTRISYAFTNHLRANMVPLFGLSALLFKGQKHWLVIESGAGATASQTVLRLDKAEYSGLIAALNAKSGKRVELLDPGASSVIQPSVGSHDEDLTVPFPMDQVSAALKRAMEGVSCKVGKSTADRIECRRSLKPRNGFGGGEAIIATLAPEGQGTRVIVQTHRGLGRNWSSPISRDMLKDLDASPH